MATQIFISIDGIKGGTANSGYADYFDAVTVDMGAGVSYNSATFVKTGSYSVEPVIVTIKHDKMLATIYQYLSQQTTTKVNIVWEQAEGDAKKKAIDLTLNDAYIVGASTGVNDIDGVAVESTSTLTFTYGSFNLVTASARGGDGSDIELTVAS